MIAIKRNCLDRSELELVVQGRISSDELDSVISHLDDCEQCRTAIEGIERDGDWLRESLLGDEADPFQAETACQIALWRMMETPSMDPVNVIAESVPQETLGPYRLLRTLGVGGMGTVYLAQHERLHRECAIKLLPRERVDQPGWLERFDREMTAVASLEHPNIVRATDAGHENGWHYLVMEHLSGLDVGRIAGRMGQLDVADACEIVRQAALGLAHVHAAGLVHRDVKPSNLMLTREGVVKLLDLGLVLSGDDPLAVDDRLTTVGHLMGTMPYMAPEQLIDSRDVDLRADIYSLGATLYRLIAGHPPHPRRGGLAKHVMAITQVEPPCLDLLREDVNSEVVELVSEMLTRDPGQRPPDATTIAQRLVSASRGHGVKRLLRQSLRKTSHAENSASRGTRSHLHVAGDIDRTNHRSRRKYLSLGALGAFLIIAGFVIKIETDRGDLVIKSDHDNLTFSVKQGDELIERIQITADDDNTLTLRKGTYVVEIEDAPHGIILDRNVVIIGRGEVATVEVQNSRDASASQFESIARRPTEDFRRTPLKTLVDPSRSDAAGKVAERAHSLYQGKDLESWLVLLTREQDPKALGQAMQAVEVLTRGTERRDHAAQATLETARKWGGLVSTGFGGDAESNTSGRYMSFLMKVFPQYFPEPGLRAIDVELASGTSQSRAAAVWLVTSALAGSTSGKYVVGGIRLDKDWSSAMTPNSGGESLFLSISNHLKPNEAEFKADDAPGQLFLNMSTALSLKLRLMTNQPISDQPWIVTRLTTDLRDAETTWKKSDPSAPTWSLTGRPPWLVSTDVLSAAVQLDGKQGFVAPWDFMAKVLPYLNRNTQAERVGGVFDAVAQHSPDILVNQIRKSITNVAFTGIVGGDGFTGPGIQWTLGKAQGQGDLWHPIDSQGNANPLWRKALNLFASHAADRDKAVETLRQVRAAFVEAGFPQEQAVEPLAAVDAAIEKLTKEEQ